ncbi:hypothetical protein L3X38_022119 [Prunus dulcis]|uniref:Transmembrane protein n=1 Tax=Prunus dulcis TaxID=3755 RepID=A0AAD4VXB3_PRUDU|nr:hypothetical protein L3X38_022119 [Prunus dulcis]
MEDDASHHNASEDLLIKHAGRTSNNQPPGLKDAKTPFDIFPNCISITAGVVVLSFFFAIKVISSSSLFLPFILSKWRKAKRLVRG